MDAWVDHEEVVLRVGEDGFVRHEDRTTEGRMNLRAALEDSAVSR